MNNRKVGPRRTNSTRSFCPNGAHLQGYWREECAIWNADLAEVVCRAPNILLWCLVNFVISQNCFGKICRGDFVCWLDFQIEVFVWTRTANCRGFKTLSYLVMWCVALCCEMWIVWLMANIGVHAIFRDGCTRYGLNFCVLAVGARQTRQLAKDGRGHRRITTSVWRKGG